MRPGLGPVALAVIAMVASNTTAAKRRYMRELQDELQAPLIDIGVTLYTVVADPRGEALIPGKPDIRLRVVGERTFGGMLDTQRDHPCIVRRTENPQRWFCSVDQYPVIVHSDDDPLGQVVDGSEGAGKTTALVMWLYMRWLEFLGARSEIGITAPVNRRLAHVRRELRRLWRPDWYRYRPADQLLELADGGGDRGTRVQLISTHEQSEAEGSRIQGFSWVACGRDEMQDQVDAHEDIEARGREAPGGRYKQLGTCTAKDSSEWRNLRDRLVRARDPDGRPLWIRRTMYGKASPFVSARFWAAKAASMSEREFRRRVEVIDVGPERATYTAWSREHNLITVPELGWEDVTTLELRRWGHVFTLLGGHDPGNLADVSLFLKAFRSRPDQRRPFWVVLAELTTEQSTTELHIVKVLEFIRRRWHVNLLDRLGRPVADGPQILMRGDPAGNTDNRTDRSVYTQFRNAGIQMLPAAYNAAGDGHGRVPRDAGIDLVNTLFCNAAGERRLFVARNPDGTPAAPRLVASLEGSERDLAGKAEMQRKGTGDLSHWPATLRYALWAIERPRLVALAAGGEA